MFFAIIAPVHMFSLGGYFSVFCGQCDIRAMCGTAVDSVIEVVDVADMRRNLPDIRRICVGCKPDI